MKVDALYFICLTHFLTWNHVRLQPHKQQNLAHSTGNWVPQSTQNFEVPPAGALVGPCFPFTMYLLLLGGVWSRRFMLLKDKKHFKNIYLMQKSYKKKTKIKLKR